MPAATLTSKGQITVPQAVRQSLGLHTGDRLDFIALQDGGFRVIALRNDVSTLRGRFAGRVQRAVSVLEMAQAVELEAAARAGGASPKRRPGQAR